MLLGQFFVKNTKMTLEHFLNGPSRKKLQIGKYRNRREQSEKWPFSTFKAPNPGHFSRYLLGILYTYTPDRALSYIFRFMENAKKSLFFENNILFDYKKKSKILTFENPRSQFDRNVHSLASVEANRFYLLNSFRDSVSRKPLFLPKTGKT